ncbi:catechol 2,3-dioxygenase-like lactoylglutathione lyase family enzyme [Herbihabitans rhizosphaerae]|uniref:Catechol 2,3-dioxygenase-like lactoylglutathione lyase family enzyme n=1 Tax=Herbihabitans rhizosphaerae TaxID=1872711 RepID=A0A4Q7KNK5_9PSEU|nr:VOC family protein [Herbihabitans rhizosphaerae]RZS37887.1 catechol 2,3-dioxygenase-like lactoylglutathione lyase family enzyme [Herbihabitans rhizosphaerae]
MPALTGVHHVSLTVTDVDRSVPWYERVLGFTEFERVDGGEGALRKVLLRGPGIGIVLALVQHPVSDRVGFDESHPGLDHLSFSVPDEKSLDDWAERLTEHGVTFSPVTAEHTSTGAAVVVFRDPDGIQLELWAAAPS